MGVKMVLLFNGQTNHELTQQERETFRQLSTIRVRKKDDQDKQGKLFHQMVNELAKTPTGCELIRMAIQKKEDLHYDFTKTWAEFDKKGALSTNTGEYDAFLDNIRIEKTLFEQKDGYSKAYCAEIFAHETLHDIQNPNRYFFNAQVDDAETCALSAQLMYEFGYTDKKYARLFEENYQKWFKYAKNPKEIPENAPSNFLKFEPVAGLNKKELQEAQQLYAIQMASLETRALYIDCFMRVGFQSVTEIKKLDSYLPMAVEEALYYHNKNDRFYPRMIEEMKQRNPFIKESSFALIKMAHGDRSQQNINTRLSSVAEKNITAPMKEPEKLNEKMR